MLVPVGLQYDAWSKSLETGSAEKKSTIDPNKIVFTSNSGKSSFREVKTPQAHVAGETESSDSNYKRRKNPRTVNAVKDMLRREVDRKKMSKYSSTSDADAVSLDIAAVSTGFQKQNKKATGRKKPAKKSTKSGAVKKNYKQKKK